MPAGNRNVGCVALQLGVGQLARPASGKGMQDVGGVCGPSVCLSAKGARRKHGTIRRQRALRSCRRFPPRAEADRDLRATGDRPFDATPVRRVAKQAEPVAPSTTAAVIQ